MCEGRGRKGKGRGSNCRYAAAAAAAATAATHSRVCAVAGYDFKQDLQKLRLLMPGLRVENVQDLRPKRGSGSLSTSVTAHLQRRLDKSETLSDWTRIPLRPAQVQYSGFDALASLELFEVLASEDGLLP
jgi:hypothetical protein